MTLSDWAAATRAPQAPIRRGNTPWAEEKARTHQRKWEAYAARSPRTLQVHLGPSELGVRCHRQVAGKMAGLPATNHVSDPWPSIRGTALHAYATEVYQYDNETNGLRWLTEHPVVPHNLHPGTLDLYDALDESVEDHKFLGEFSMEKVKSEDGPPHHYQMQLLLYARGARRLGLRVSRVALLAYPATGSSLNSNYVWERVHTAQDDADLAEVFEWTEYRRQWAVALISGSAQLSDVPAHTEDADVCHFCPFYRPAMAHGNVGGIGCPGGVKGKEKQLP